MLIIILVNVLYLEPHLFLSGYFTHRRAFNLRIHPQTLVSMIITVKFVLNDNKPHFFTIQCIKTLSVFEAIYSTFLKTGFIWKKLILQFSRRIKFAIVLLLSSWLKKNNYVRLPYFFPSSFPIAIYFILIYKACFLLFNQLRKNYPTNMNIQTTNVI